MIDEEGDDDGSQRVDAELVGEQQPVDANDDDDNNDERDCDRGPLPLLALTGNLDQPVAVPRNTRLQRKRRVAQLRPGCSLPLRVCCAKF